MDKTLTIRRLGRQDWEQFRNVRLLALKTHASVYGSTFEAENRMTQEEWIDLLGNERHGIFGLFDGHDLVGLSSAFSWKEDESGKSAILCNWFLKESYRGDGRFINLVQKTIDWVKEQGRFERIIVSHREGNEGSRKANQKLGFSYTETVSRFWPDGVEADEHMYEIKLKG